MQIILENIRFELNLKRNHYLFFNTLEVAATTFEKFASLYFAIDFNGCYAELKQNPEFEMDLLMVASEIDINQYINPKTSLFMHIIKSYYMKYAENKMQTQMSTQNINPEKLQEFKLKMESMFNKNNQL